MTENKMMFWSIIIAIILCLMIVFKYMPIWFSSSVALALAIGCIIGWLIRKFYDRYVDNDKN